MNLNDENTRAVVAGPAGQRIMTAVVHFRRLSADWDNHPQGGNEAYLEMLKTDLVMLAGCVQERINRVTVSTPEDFG
jgi:hypothetical protein